MKNSKAKMLNHTSSTIGTDVMRKKMGEVLDSVYFRGDEFIIERKHKPLAALVSIKKYREINKLAREFLINSLSQHKNPEISEQRSEDLANEVKHQVRKS